MKPSETRITDLRPLVPAREASTRSMTSSVMRLRERGLVVDLGGAARDEGVARSMPLALLARLVPRG